MSPPPSLDVHPPDGSRLLDELAANATPAPVTRLVDGWLCKLAPELPFRRANAVLPAAGAGADDARVADTLGAIEALYRSAGQRVLIQVSSARGDDGVALNRLLDARGYEIEAPVDVLVADVEVVADAGSRAGDRLRVTMEEEVVAGTDLLPITVTQGVDDKWCAAHGLLHGDDERRRERTEGYGRMLAGLGPAVLAASAGPVPIAEASGGFGGALASGTDGAQVLPEAASVGVGFAVLERGWAGVFGMGTAPAWRRRGGGGALLGALAAEARKCGATRLYLQVETDNAAAQALYRGLGFTRSHGYHYRVSERS